MLVFLLLDLGLHCVNRTVTLGFVQCVDYVVNTVEEVGYSHVTLLLQESEKGLRMYANFLNALINEKAQILMICGALGLELQYKHGRNVELVLLIGRLEVIEYIFCEKN